MLSLFRAATGEDWTDIMYINIHGCQQYGYSEDMKPPCDEDSSKGFGVTAAVFFVVFFILGALILLTLFIGVVTTAMEEAEEDAKAEADLQERLQKFTDE